MMNGVLKAPIGDFENKLSFPSEETLLDSGLPSHLPLADVYKFLATITSSSLIFSSGERAQFSSPGPQMIEGIFASLEISAASVHAETEMNAHYREPYVETLAGL